MAALSLPTNGEVFAPDGLGAEAALSRTTDMAVVAHPDDAEIVGLSGIGDAFGSKERWFTAVICTDGAGSVRTAALEELSGGELAAIRWSEQRRASEVGSYAAAVWLGRSSRDLRTGDRSGLVEDLRLVLAATRPEVVFTHNPADRHLTHVAVVTAVLEALSTLGPDDRPRAVYGVEAWGDLDWLPDADKVRFDVSTHTVLASELMACFGSQLAGGKRFDVALAGRRRANATLFDPHRPDEETEVVVAMDLSPLVAGGGGDLGRFLEQKIRRFQREVLDRL